VNEYGDGQRLAVTADVILLDADGIPRSPRNFKHNLGVAHQIAVLLAIVSDGHQLAAARAGADMLDDQPKEAGHFQADRRGQQRRNGLAQTWECSPTLLTAKLDGGRRFCAECKIDPELLLSHLPGYDTVRRTEEAARIMACTPEEATAWLRERGNETVEAPKVETVSASLWAFVNSRAEWWG
jgi:hypothetical protein